MANPIRTERARYTMAGLPPGAVLAILALESLILLILFLGWFVGHWAWLRQSFPGGLFAGAFPIVVTWAGAAGGIANAVHGLTTHWSYYIDPITSDYEREKWNARSLAQGPLGAVYGSAGILLLVLVLGVIGSNSSGTLDLSPAGRLTVTAIAFLIGYHQQIFHQLVTRTVEAMFAPRLRISADHRQLDRERARPDVAITPASTDLQTDAVARAEAGEAAAQSWHEGVYNDDIAGYGSRGWQDAGYRELVPDAEQQRWTDGGYTEVPAAPGSHPWDHQTPAAADAQSWAESRSAAADAQTWAESRSAAADAQTWADAVPAQTSSQDSHGRYAGPWAEPSASRSDQAAQGIAGVGENPTAPVETEAPESVTVQTEQAESVEAEPVAVESLSVEPAETKRGEPDAVEPAETEPAKTNAAKTDPGETGAAKIDGVEPRTEEAVASESVVPDQITARRARTTTTRRVRRQAR